MQLLKRNGSLVSVDDIKLTTYIKALCQYEPVLTHVEVDKVLQGCIQSFGTEVRTAEVPHVIAEVSAAMTTEHHHYSKLAGRCIVEALHKETPEKFTEFVRTLRHLFNSEFLDIVDVLGSQLDALIINYRDFQYDIFAIKTLERSYLLKHNSKIQERPQYMLMRVAVAIALGQLNAEAPTLDICLLYTSPSPRD